MSSSKRKEEHDSLSNCIVCLCDFNKVEKRPLYLPCIHTFCLQCLKNIQRHGLMVVCPLCRRNHSIKSLTNLPCNEYALKLVQLKMENAELSAKAASRVPFWCLCCGSVADLHCFEAHEAELVPMDDPSERSVKEAESLQKLYMRREETRFGVDYSINKLESTQSQLDKALAYIRRVEAHVLNSIGSNDHLLRDMTALARDMDRVVIKEETVSSLNVKMGKMATIYQDLSTMVTIQLTDSEKLLHETVRMPVSSTAATSFKQKKKEATL